MKTSNLVVNPEALKDLTLAELTKLANNFQEELGLKLTKRFATKPAAIKKVIALQAEIKPEPAKPAPEVDADLVEPLTIETNRKAVKPAPKKAAVKTTLSMQPL